MAAVESADSRPSWWRLVYGGGWRKTMEDLADKIDDLICTFENGADLTMDTVAMYLFLWLIVGLTVVGFGRYVYGRFVSRPVKEEPTAAVDGKAAAAVTETAPTKEPTPKPVASGRAAPSPARYVPPTPPSRKRLGSRTGRQSPGPVVIAARGKSAAAAVGPPPPSATGPDSVSVKWVTEMFAWLYSDLVVVNEALAIWLQSLNEFTKKSVAEHGVGVEFVRVLPETSVPSINNVFCECAPNDDVVSTELKLFESNSGNLSAE
ncbi:Phorbol esters/diacylglycerol Hypothetical protein domain (C1 domain) [Nesidiocoris tenuis]|uniref:Uncharacterized protein n=2 Tax=Nesidiocoris tenuis TaxID=355587 RepID=A0ABN7B6D9_9HEMI|nr:Phorbol esters/diacylglycerol Hypothetical protein domain (C1 domain) [Nesidiocoris tenuis]